MGCRRGLAKHCFAPATRACRARHASHTRGSAKHCFAPATADMPCQRTPPTQGVQRSVASLRPQRICRANACLPHKGFSEALLRSGHSGYAVPTHASHTRGSAKHCFTPATADVPCRRTPRKQRNDQITSLLRSATMSCQNPASAISAKSPCPFSVLPKIVRETGKVRPSGTMIVLLRAAVSRDRSR